MTPTQETSPDDASAAYAERPDPADYDVPADATPADCEYCGRQFATESLLALHRGQAHGAELDADQREAYESAHEAEDDDLRRFRLKALAVLVLLYFGLLMIYALVV